MSQQYTRIRRFARAEEGKISHIMEPGKENSLYEYFLSDHLGNVRAVIADENEDGVPELLSNSFYYPFGLTIPLKTSTSTENKYLYNGKEIQNESGLNWFDYGARMYDPAIGRWHVPDPLTEKASSWTPYRYAFNNPINIIDPNGMEESEIFDIGGGAYNWVQHYVIDLDNSNGPTDGASPYFTNEGKYLGVDKNEFAGQIYITTEEAFQNNSIDGVANRESLQDNENTKSMSESLVYTSLSDEAKSKIYTKTLSMFTDIKSERLYNGKVSIMSGISSTGKAMGYNNPDYFPRAGWKNVDGTHRVTVGKWGFGDYTTVENIWNGLGVHEIIAHGVNGIPGGKCFEHAEAYKLQKTHPTFDKTTESFQKSVNDSYKRFINY